MERSDEWISLPRYVKRSVDSTTVRDLVIALELVLPHAWPKFWILVVVLIVKSTAIYRVVQKRNVCFYMVVRKSFTR